MLDDKAQRVFWRLFSEFCGMPRPEVPCSHPSKKEMQVAIGWPALNIGIAYDADPKVIAAFERAGWQIYPLSPGDLRRTVPLLHLLHDLSFERTVRESINGAKHNVSKEENRLFAAVIRAGLPEPDRNYEYVAPHGQRTTPDMVWENVKLAVFVDGLFHHGGRDRDQLIKAAAEDPEKAKHLEETQRSRVTKDAAARRAMVAEGWRTIVVTDTELADPDEVQEAAFEIVTAYQQYAA